MTDPQPGSDNAMRRWAPLLILGLGCLFLFGWGVGSYSLNDPWEPRYPQTVREMMQRGTLITPYYENEIRWAKPILTYWAMFPTIAIFGNNEFAARLPSVLSATFGVLMVYFFLSRLRGRAVGMIAAGILATTPQYFFMARQATPDMHLTAFLGAALAFFALGRFGKERKRLYYLLFYASVGMAFLAKGPVACVITLGAVGLFWLIDIDVDRLLTWRSAMADLRNTFSSYHVWLGALVFFVVASSWYLAAWIKHGYDLIDHFFRGENIHRFAEPVKGLIGTSSHYVETIFHGMFPWNGFLPLIPLSLAFGQHKLDEEWRQRWYYFSWLMSIFLLFTFSGTKLDHYILPITVSLAILVALIWEQYLKEDRPFWVGPAFLVSLGFSVLPFRDFLTLSNQFIMDAYTNKHEIDNVEVEQALRIIFAIWVVVIFSAVILRRFARVIATVAVLSAFGTGIYFSHYVLPLQEQVRSVKHYVQYYQENGAPGASLVFYGKKRHSVTYYSGGEEGFTHYTRGRAASLVRWATGRSDVYIIAERLYANRLLQELRQQTNAPWFRTTSGNPNYDLISNANIRGLRF